MLSVMKRAHNFKNYLAFILLIKHFKPCETYNISLTPYRFEIGSQKGQRELLGDIVQTVLVTTKQRPGMYSRVETTESVSEHRLFTVRVRRCFLFCKAQLR